MMDTGKLYDEFEAGRRERAEFMALVIALELAERQAAALERIAAVLEKVTNNEMLSVAFWEQV